MRPVDGDRLPAWPTARGKKILRAKLLRSRAKGKGVRNHRRAMKRRES